MEKYFLFLFLFASTIGYTQSKDEKIILAAVERLNNALVTADSSALDKLTTTELSYGHSSGKVEDKQTFIHNAVSGSFKFLSINATDQVVILAKRNAIVRHLFTAKATNNGAPADVKLGVLLVWQKQGRAWKLLARQAVKL
jgi:ketosteroid isomerase-like protein